MATKHETEKAQAVQVFIRTRPLSKQELEARSGTCMEIVNSKEVNVNGKKYSFNQVFTPNVEQVVVYSNVVAPLISEVLAGYNCTIFAYGQTGTGKTYTMAGASDSSPSVSWLEDREGGIIPRALSHLFDELGSNQQPYTVCVTYLELYNEELFDLLSENVEGKGIIGLFEDRGSVIIRGITKVILQNKRDVYPILRNGEKKRRTAPTLINPESSRSHTVFSITVHTYETTVEGEEVVKTGKLNLVDLAGSENISRSGAVAHHAREAGNINQSLLTLERVTRALVERSARIPYRDSKLTRILQDSLGGSTKTSIIATISPACCCLEETLSTLDYANRSRNITNRPKVNQRVPQKALEAQYEKEMAQLRKDLEAASTTGGVCLNQINYDRLVSDSKELSEKKANVRDLGAGMTETLGNIVEKLQEIQDKQAKQDKQDKISEEINIMKEEMHRHYISVMNRLDLLEQT